MYNRNKKSDRRRTNPRINASTADTSQDGSPRDAKVGRDRSHAQNYTDAGTRPNSSREDKPPGRKV